MPCEIVWGTKVPGNEKSWERKFLRTKGPGNESSRERKGPGTKVPHRDYSFLGTKGLGHEKSWYPNRHITTPKFPSLRPEIPASIMYKCISKRLIDNIISISSDLPNSIMIRGTCFSHNISNNPRPGPATFHPYIVPENRFMTYWSYSIIPSGNMTCRTNMPCSGHTDLTSCQTCLCDIINKCKLSTVNLMLLKFACTVALYAAMWLSVALHHAGLTVRCRRLNCELWYLKWQRQDCGRTCYRHHV